MGNEAYDSARSSEMDISTYECLSRFRAPLFDSIIRSSAVPAGSYGLDAGCGIGAITRLLSGSVGKNGRVIGLDLSRDFINYARNNNQTESIQFIEGDVNALPFDDDSFDWVWSVDTVWPGPKESGCPSENPSAIIKEFYRVLKPGGRVFVLFWSSQKLLAGYPVLEAVLNTTSSATTPFYRGMDPLNHIMNGRNWLEKTDFKNIAVNTYVGDITAPINENDRNALSVLFDMFWGESGSEITESDWKDFNALCDPDSGEYILNNKNYYGFYTYTLFKGSK